MALMTSWQLGRRQSLRGDSGMKRAHWVWADVPVGPSKIWALASQLWQGDRDQTSDAVFRTTGRLNIAWRGVHALTSDS